MLVTVVAEWGVNMPLEKRFLSLSIVSPLEKAMGDISPKWAIFRPMCDIMFIMNRRHPFSVITPTLDGDILAVLARADKSFTGREIERAISASHDGVRQAIKRLEREGVVQSERAGRANLFRLNRRHLAAPMIEELASLHLQLISRLQEKVGAWSCAPLVAVLFGSVARGEEDYESDLDILLVRPQNIDVDDEVWHEQVVNLEEEATAWTGNEARVLEYGYEELQGLVETEMVVRDAVKEGILLYGSMADLKPRRERSSWA